MNIRYVNLPEQTQNDHFVRESPRFHTLQLHTLQLTETDGLLSLLDEARRHILLARYREKVIGNCKYFQSVSSGGHGYVITTLIASKDLPRVEED